MSEHQHLQNLCGINNHIFIIHNTVFPHRSQISSVSHYNVSIVSLKSRAASRLHHLNWIYKRLPDGSKTVLCMWRTVLFCWAVSFFKPITLDVRRHADEVRESLRWPKGGERSYYLGFEERENRLREKKSKWNASINVHCLYYKTVHICVFTSFIQYVVILCENVSL